MFGPMAQNWRQIMQMPQQMQSPSGLGFPTRNATGGWQMPGGPAPFQPKPLAPPPAPAPNPAPGNGYAFYNGAWHSPESVWGTGGQPAPMMGFGVGGNTGYGQMGMGITGQGAFGDLGAFGMGYGDTY